LPAVSASNLTASDLLAAMQVAREVEEARRAADVETPLRRTIPRASAEEIAPAASNEHEVAAAPAEENVRPLSSVRVGK
jgi:hypothetical protein